MASMYKNAAGVDFDNIFEPASVGYIATAPGFKLADGSTMEYAPVADGTAGALVDYFILAGSRVDLSNVFALKGSVGYLVNPATWPNFNDTIAPYHAAGLPNGSQNAVMSVHLSDTLDSTTTLTFNPDGTWDLVQYGTNNWNDHTFVYYNSTAALNIYIENDRPAVTVASGNWASNPQATIGDNYTIEMSASSAYGTIGPNNATGSAGWTETEGTFHQQVDGTIQAQTITYPSTATSLSTAQSAVLTFNVEGNFQTADLGLDGVLRWFYYATVDVTISNTAGTESVSGSISLMNILNWAPYGQYNIPNAYATPTPAPTPSPTPTPSPAPLSGGGGCLAPTMYVRPKLMAKDVQIGNVIDTAIFNPDTLAPSRVSEVLELYGEYWELQTVSGITVIASDSTPMPLQGQPSKLLPHLVPGVDKVFVDDEGKFGWEVVESVTRVGEGPVILLRTAPAPQCFFAGTTQARRIATHIPDRDYTLRPAFVPRAPTSPTSAK